MYFSSNQNLSVNHTLPIHKILDKKGAVLGYVLGYPIMNGRLLYESSIMCVWPEEKLTEKHIEDFLREISGRYLLLVEQESSGVAFVYPDPFASLSVVYSSERQIFASTTSLMHFVKFLLKIR